MASTALQKKEKNDFPEWIYQSLRVLKPPEKLTVSEWAEKYRILDSKTSAEPGRWKNSRTPYLVEIMDSFNDPEIEEIIFIKSTQIGGTEALNNIIAYIVAQDQSPTLVVYPPLELAEFTSSNRLQPMFKLCPETSKNYYDRESKILELQFNGMYLALSGANSPSSLASRPIRYLILDEIDKFPKKSGKEADPSSLAEERTKTFVHNKKIAKTSTPTTSDGEIQKAFDTADTQKYYYVPCPHCGTFQILRFNQIKWDKNYKSIDDVRSSAYYQCEKCSQAITDNYKMMMLRSGIWKEAKNKGKRRTAFFINAIYSPWLRFGDVAAKFLESKDDPDKLQNFINSWLAEPWKEVESKLDYQIVLERQTQHEESVIPSEALLLTAGVDVQEHSFYYSIRAWGTNLTSWGITHGQVETWDDIEYIMNLPYQQEGGGAMQVQICAIDTGHKTEEVYDFVVKNMDWAVAVKGSSRELTKRYNISSIDKKDSKAYGLSLYLVDGSKYKDQIAGRLQRDNGKGSFMVHSGCDVDYAKQLTSEEKIKEKGRFVWRPKPGSPNNHYLDTEVYSCLAADLLQVRYLTDVNNIVKNQENREPKEDSFIKNQSNWLSTKQNWLKK